MIGITPGYLAKIERGTSGFRRQRHEVLERAADLYGVPSHEMFESAGYLDVPVPVILDAGPRAARTRREDRVRERFRGIVLHPAVRPDGLSEEALDYVSPRLLAAWVDFAENLEGHLRGGGESIEVLARWRETDR